MSPDDIRAAVAASPELQALAAAGQTQAIADALSVGRTRRIEIEAWRAQRYFIKRAKWRAFVALAETVGHPARAAAQAAVDLTSNGAMLVDFADPDPATSAMWGALVQTGLCTAAERDEIRGWCVCADPVTHTDVGAALQGAAQ